MKSDSTPLLMIIMIIGLIGIALFSLFVNAILDMFFGIEISFWNTFLIWSFVLLVNLAHNHKDRK